MHDIERLAELGVVMLLFSLGLEVSFRELAPVRAVALIGGTIQVLLTILLGLGLGYGLGWEWRQAVWFGGLIALSSTMVALKTIQAQGRLGTLSARVMLGILVVQDLAVVPLMIVLPELSDPAGDFTKVAVAAVRAAAAAWRDRALLHAGRAHADEVRGALELARAVLPGRAWPWPWAWAMWPIASACRWPLARSWPAWS